MTIRILSACAILGLSCTALLADDYDDAREDAYDAWRDYQKELRDDPYDDDVWEAWRDYCRAQQRLRYWRPAYSDYRYGSTVYVWSPELGRYVPLHGTPSHGGVGANGRRPPRVRDDIPKPPPTGLSGDQEKTTPGATPPAPKSNNEPGNGKTGPKTEKASGSPPPPALPRHTPENGARERP